MIETRVGILLSRLVATYTIKRCQTTSFTFTHGARDSENVTITQTPNKHLLERK